MIVYALAARRVKPTLWSRHLILPLLFLILCFPSVAAAQWNPLNPVVSVQKEPDGARFTLQKGDLRLQVCSDSIIRVRYSPGKSVPVHPDLVVIKSSWPATKWEMQSSGESVVLNTAQIKAVISRKDSSVTFQDGAGKTLFQQTEVTMTPVVVNGEQTYHAELFSKLWGSHESFYGLGQHQAGVWNYRGESIDLSQENTNIAIPLLMSSNGYGLFWNNSSRSRFNNRFANYLYVSIYSQSNRTGECAKVRSDSVSYYWKYRHPHRFGGFHCDALGQNAIDA